MPSNRAEVVYISIWQRYTTQILLYKLLFFGLNICIEDDKTRKFWTQHQYMNNKMGWLLGGRCIVYMLLVAIMADIQMKKLKSINMKNDSCVYIWCGEQCVHCNTLPLYIYLYTTNIQRKYITLNCINKIHKKHTMVVKHLLYLHQIGYIRRAAASDKLYNTKECGGSAIYKVCSVPRPTCMYWWTEKRLTRS